MHERKTPAGASPRLEFYGGAWVSFAPFIVFILLIVVTSFWGGSISDGALWLPAFSALVLPMPLAKDKRAYTDCIVSGIASKEVVTPFVCRLFAGVFSAMLRSSGLAGAIAGFAANMGVGSAAFTVVTFIAAALFSTASGTGFGTITAGMGVLYPAGTALGCCPPLLAGAVISGAIFGDNLAPVSDTTICSASSQGAAVPDVVRSRLKYSLLSAALTAAAFAVCGLVLGGEGGAPGARAEYDPSAFWMLLSVALTVAVAVKCGDIIIATTVGIVSAAVVGVATGQFAFLQVDPRSGAPDALFRISGAGLERTVDGIVYTGLASMLQVGVFALLLFGSVALMRGGGGDKKLLAALEGRVKTARGAELIISAMVLLLLSAAMGLNAPAILAVGPSFAKPLSKRFGISPCRAANLLDAQSNALVYALPRTPAVLFAVGIASNTQAPLSPEQVTPFVLYGYILPAVMTASILLGFGRQEGPQEDKQPARTR